MVSPIHRVYSAKIYIMLIIIIIKYSYESVACAVFPPVLWCGWLLGYLNIFVNMSSFFVYSRSHVFLKVEWLVGTWSYKYGGGFYLNNVISDYIYL